MVSAKDLMVEKYISVDANDAVSKLITKLLRAEDHVALVFEKGKYVGLAGRRLLLNSKLDPQKMKVKNAIAMRSRGRIPFFVPKISPHDDLLKICKLLSTSKSKALPVIDKNKVIGVVRASDAALMAAKEYDIPCDVLANMTPVTIKEDDKISKAITLMRKYSIGHLPVVDARNKISGMVAVGDILANPNLWEVTGQKISSASHHQGGKKKGYDAGEKTSARNLPVKSFMSKKTVCTIPPKGKIISAVKEMVANNVNSIVLAVYNAPVGVLTLSDILKDYAKGK